MMERRQRGEVLVATEIPFDLQIEIVNRLSVKSLARFKCVSKLWFSVISSKGSFFESPPRLYISSIARNKCELLSLSLASTSKSKSNTVFDLDITKHVIGGYDLVALRGLLLYTICDQACIYNPTTGQRLVLPPIMVKEYMKHFNYYSLGYDPVLDQYKVVFTVVWSEMYAGHWVFVLETGSSWKRIEFGHPYFPMGQGLCINGLIYYLAYSDVSRDNIISFDVRSEEFNTIQGPGVVYEFFDSKYLELIEYAGKPTIFDHRRLREPLVNLWVLEDAGKWSKKTLVLQKHFFPSLIYFAVMGTTQNGEVILKPGIMFYPYYILYYDLHKNDVRRVEIRGISEEPFDLALMDTGVSIMHLKI